MPGLPSSRLALSSLRPSVRKFTDPLLEGSLLPMAGLQALWLLWRRVSILPEPEGPTEGCAEGRGRPLRVLFVGDSSVVGVGVGHTRQAVGAAFARTWVQRTGRAVNWRLRGEYGATVDEVCTRVVPELPGEAVDLIVISAGTNDIMRRTAVQRFAVDFRRLVSEVRARAGNVPVVVCQLPPMWCFPALPEPLRSWASVRRDLLDREQQRVVAELEDAVFLAGVERVDPTLFAEDGFHPCEAGYQYWAERICDLWSDRSVVRAG